MKVKAFFIHIILILMFSHLLLPSFSQQPYQVSKIIPPSPNAASLGVYGDYNVGYYTGVPDISIPIYEIKTSNHTLPITMSYNATGVRVSDVASWVGLNWSLSAGGVISRTIRGGDDFATNGYQTSSSLPTETNPLLLQDKPYYDNILNNYTDAEPDIFSYSFGNSSGKFVLGKQIDGSKTYSATQNNFKIEYQPSQYTWTITTGDGYKYIFSQIETCEDYNFSGGFELSNSAPLSNYSIPINNTVTSWYLTQIVSPTGEAITFEYQVKSKSLSLVNKSESEFNLLLLSTGCSSTPYFKGIYQTFTSSRQATEDRYLTKIVFSLGTIEFNTTDRDDIEYLNTSKPKKLSEIVIKNNAGDLIKKFSFTHSYFGSGSADISDIRLKLDAITESGADGSVKPPHSFSYFDPQNIPRKYSKSVDNWGFYNAQPNTTLLPSRLVTTFPPDKFFKGGSRVPSGDDISLKKGVLKTITYPTGGITEFDYENNVYNNPSGDDKYLTVQQTKNVQTGFPFQPDNPTADFVLSSKTYVTFSFNFEKVADGNSIDNVRTEYAYVYKTGQLTPKYSFSNFYCGIASEQLSCATDPTVDRSFSVLLDPGTYRIEVGSLYPYLFTMHADYEDKVLVTQRKGGGLRVRSIKNSGGGVASNIRKFVYEDSNHVSTGILLAEPVYDFLGTFREAAPSDCFHEASYLARMSSSIVPPGLSSSSAIVGYSKVIEKLGENGEGGTIEHIYYNSQDLAGNFPFLPGTGSSLNGKEAVTFFKDAANVGVKKIDYNYETNSIANLKGVKIYQPPLLEQGSNSDYTVKFFDNYSYWPVLKSKIETLYTATGSQVETTKYVYANADHMEITSQEFTKSDNAKTVIKKFKYPGDYPSAGTASFVSKLKERHIISPVIEEQTLQMEGGVTKLIGGSFTEYDVFQGLNSTFYKPSVSHKINTNVPLSDLTESNISSTNVITHHPKSRPELYYDQYDDKGNIRMLHKAYDLPKSYLWGYDKTYPVAEVTGADYSTIDALVNQNVLNHPSTDEQLRVQLNLLRTGLASNKALVNTYTYRPLYGLNSETDPTNRTTFYEYDNFQRLRMIKDNDQNILKKFDYGYADKDVYTAAALNALVDDFRQVQPGRMRALFDPPFNSPQDRSKFIHDTRLIYRDGLAQLPAQYQVVPFASYGWYTSFNLQLADPYDPVNNNAAQFCFMSEGYSVEWRLKMPRNQFNSNIVAVGSYFQFAASFTRKNGYTYLTSYEDPDGHKYGSGQTPVLNFDGTPFTELPVGGEDLFDDFAVIKLRASRNRYYVYVNGVEKFSVARSNNQIPFDTHFYVDALFFGNSGAIDWIKVYDKGDVNGNNPVIKFEENFDSPAKPVTPDTSLLCPAPQNCLTAFVTYFNQRNGTSYTEQEIKDIYQSITGVPLNVCN